MIDNPIAPALALPWLGALLIALAGRVPNLRDSLASLTTLATFGAVVHVQDAFSDRGRTAWEVLEVMPGLPLRFEVEPLGMLFALVASGLWIVTNLYAVGYMRGHHESHQTRFFVCFTVAIGAALGIAFAGNLVTLFLFYELLTFSTFPLVTHHGTEEAKRSGRVYLGVLVSTSICFFLLAILWTWDLTGTLEFRAGGILAGKAGEHTLLLLLGLYAFGTGKAALMPFHRWLPAAMVAPTPVSALLHAVAVVKAGVFTILKITIYVFGIELLTQTSVSHWLMYAASFTIIAASLVALTRDNLKARLAYSTVSQLAYIVLGAALATADGVIGGGMHIVMHALAKITLFFCAGAVYITAHKTLVSQLDGIGRRMPFTMGAFFVASLSIIGLPPLGGAWSKWYLAQGAAEAHEPLFIGVLMLSSLLSIGYLMPIVARAFLFEATSDGEPTGLREAPLACVVPICITALGCVVLFFTSDDIRQLLLPLVDTGTLVTRR